MFPILLGKNNELEKRVKTLEDSGGSDDKILVVTENENGTLNKTWQEIHDTKFAVIKYSDSNDEYKRVGFVYILNIIDYVNEEIYSVQTTLGDKYNTTSANGYPTLAE